jgi:hypothetical protein
LTSPYCGTIYFDKNQRETFRVFLTEGGFMCYLVNENGILSLQPVTAVGDNIILVMSPQGWLFTAPKGAGKQHTSFVAGGPVLFAGYWKINNGRITYIKDESGHYSIPITGLQNLAQYLYVRGFSREALEHVTFIHVNRSLHLKTADEDGLSVLPLVEKETIPLNTLLSSVALDRGVYQQQLLPASASAETVINLTTRNTELLFANRF